MASNETSQPTTETRDEISPVNSTAPVDRENAPAPTTRPDQPQGSVNGNGPPLPTRPTGNPSVQQPLQPYPQYQLPYAPYPYQPQPYPYASPMRVLPSYSKAWTASKLILTVLSTVFAIIILALSCVFIGEGGEAENTSYYALPISIAAILWNGAELITFGCRARKDVKRGIHPGAHVGLHLCFWLACVFAVLITVTVSLSLQSMIRDCAEMNNNRYSYWSYCDDYRYQDGTYVNDMYLPTVRAMVAVFCLATINHFILFVLACIETHKRNCLKPAGVVMPPAPAGGMYYPPPPLGAAPYYPYPMPMAPQQARFAPSPNVPGGVASNTPQAPATAQNYQNLAGFYAPMPTAAPAQHREPPSPSRAAANSDNEKAVPSISTPAGTAL
ncbi:hypothetical protein F4819DRAFT_460496 [Hypoxylon fuscum]|nr:hypothetical protein F4819DRAFT_460496 [Hypoxylon fuscum]